MRKTVYSNYEEKKLCIHEEDVGNKGGTRGIRNRNKGYAGGGSTG